MEFPIYEDATLSSPLAIMTCAQIIYNVKKSLRSLYSLIYSIMLFLLGNPWLVSYGQRPSPSPYPHHKFSWKKKNPAERQSVYLENEACQRVLHKNKDIEERGAGRGGGLYGKQNFPSVGATSPPVVVIAAQLTHSYLS